MEKSQRMRSTLDSPPPLLGDVDVWLGAGTNRREKEMSVPRNKSIRADLKLVSKKWMCILSWWWRTGQVPLSSSLVSSLSPSKYNKRRERERVREGEWEKSGDFREKEQRPNNGLDSHRPRPHTWVIRGCRWLWAKSMVAFTDSHCLVSPFSLFLLSQDMKYVHVWDVSSNVSFPAAQRDLSIFLSLSLSLFLCSSSSPLLKTGCQTRNFRPFLDEWQFIKLRLTARPSSSRSLSLLVWNGRFLSLLASIGMQLQRRPDRKRVSFFLPLFWQWLACYVCKFFPEDANESYFLSHILSLCSLPLRPRFLMSASSHFCPYFPLFFSSPASSSLSYPQTKESTMRGSILSLILSKPVSICLLFILFYIIPLPATCIHSCSLPRNYTCDEGREKRDEQEVLFV